MSRARAWTLRCAERWSFLVLRAEDQRWTTLLPLQKPAPDYEIPIPGKFVDGSTWHHN